MENRSATKAHIVKALKAMLACQQHGQQVVADKVCVCVAVCVLAQYVLLVLYVLCYRCLITVWFVSLEFHIHTNNTTSSIN